MSLITRTDVTAVKLYGNYIFAGVGSYANVFDKESTKLLTRVHALEGQKIYGFVISQCKQKVLAFGGKQFTVLSVQTFKLSQDSEDADVIVTRLFEPVICDDWLHSGVWVEADKVVLLTAHNVVQKWDISTRTQLSQHPSMDNSILYSGLLLPLQDSVLIFAGTVFSEVIVHDCGSYEPLHRLKGHRGVIFSINCSPEKGVIVTTSDDRSVRIWGITSMGHMPDTKAYWAAASIVCNHEVYGHTARVMRSCITKEHIVSVGEDAAICFWNFQGKLLRKIMSHQNGSIWSVDADDHHIVTGGGDSGIILHPLTIVSDYGTSELMDIDVDTPKKIAFTSRRNLVIITDNDLVHYNMETRSKLTYKLYHESTYKLLSLSSCKQIIAVTDMCGNLNVFIENCNESAYLQNIISTKLHIGKILSMHWAGNRYLVLCSENGNITVLASKDNATEIFAKFVLPPCKERWLTASDIDTTSNILTLGDRCGNIHIYTRDQKDPIKTFNKVHGRYGPTSINIKKNEIVTTGRDGTIRYFNMNEDVSQIKFMYSKELEFQWVEKFLDKDGNMICGFQERVFVVYDVKMNSKILEMPCGGGHRSWDAVRYFKKVKDNFEQYITVIYIKNTDIYLGTFIMSKIMSKNIVNGSHCKEINCLKTYKTDLDKGLTFYITGGEDTSLRISSLSIELQFQDELIFKQLSNIRTLKTYPIESNKIILISAGGRAQISIKIVSFYKEGISTKLKTQNLIDYLIKGTDKERKGNQTWRNCSIDFDPETRIMDVGAIQLKDNDFLIFAGCSDACLRIFRLMFDSKNVLFKPVQEIKHHKTCVLKTTHIKLENKDILATCTTRGEITFWEVTYTENLEQFNIEPIFTMNTNKSGINCFDYRILPNSNILIATGGDDNALHLNLLNISNTNNLKSMKISHRWYTDKFHCSQITGVVLLDDVVVSTSIDQRVTVFKWEINDDIRCEFVTQMYSDVADIQGIDILDVSRDVITACVYGKGMEVLTLPSVKNK